MPYPVNTTPLLQEVESDDHTDEASTRDDKPFFQPLEPKDRYHMGYLIFYLIGIATLLPWNFYVTANDVSIALKLLASLTETIDICLFLVLDV